MKNRFAHIIPLLFLLLVLLPFLGLLLLQGAQWYLKNTAEKRMQHSALITLSLPASKAVWHKKGKELSIDGKLFDVKSFHLANGTLTATGFFDDEEMDLIHFLTKLSLPGKNNNLLHLLLVLQCFIAPLLFYAIRSAVENRITHVTSLLFLLPLPFCRLIEQPPQG